MNQKGLAHILIILILLAGLGATLYLSQHTQIFKPKAAAPSEKQFSSLTEEEKRIAGIDENGKLITERAKFLAEVYPEGYQKLLSQGLIENPSEVENDVRINQRVKEEQSREKQSQRPILTDSSISSCGNITSSGDYALTQDITADGGVCINIHDTQNVNLDCRSHTIITTYNPDISPYGIAVSIKNVQNFSIKNCSSIQSKYRTDRYKYIGPSSVEILNSHLGSVQNSTIGAGSIRIRDSNNLQFLNNTINTLYWQVRSSSNQIINNKFKITGAWVGGVVTTVAGESNTIENNTVDGGWDGSSNEIATDDGIVITGEVQDKISGNVVSNNYDCGIETVGFIKDTQIINNKISNSGLCGIGGWYKHSWVNNTIDSNTVEGSAYLLYMFRADSLDQNEQSVYFKNNTFSNNTFSHQRSSSYIGPTQNYSTLIDFQNLPSGIPIQLGNNIFRNNDFGETLPAPMLIPASMIVDQGGNKCLYIRDDITRPLNCSGLTVSPSPMVKCQTDSDCGEGMRCLLPVCANPDPEQICREAPDKAKCFAQVEQKARQRCAGRCVKTPGF